MTITSNGGLQLFNIFWDQLQISSIIDNKVSKHSGVAHSSIIKNLTVGKMLGYSSLTELSDETKKEFFLSENANIDRTNYSRNMNKIGHYKQNTILRGVAKQATDMLKLGKRARKKALQVFDGSPLEVDGETFEGAEWVHDGRKGKNGLAWGYDVLTQIVKAGARCFPANFRVNDADKEWMISSSEQIRKLFDINRVAFDAGYRGMDFFYKLNQRDFLFYTKATMNWIWDLHSFSRTTTQLAEQAKSRFLRNHKYVEYTVKKTVDEGAHKGEVVKLRLVFVKDDPRVFLTNDFESPPKEIYEFYNDRWSIEETFKEEKDNLCFEKLTVRKQNAIRTHIMTVFLAFTICQLILARFPSIKGIKLLIRHIVKNIAQLVKTATGVALRFLQRFNYRRALEKQL